MSTHLTVRFPPAHTTHGSLSRCPLSPAAAAPSALVAVPPRFKELRDYVLARRDALGGGARGPGKAPSMMDLDLDDATALKKSGKGFA